MDLLLENTLLILVDGCNYKTNHKDTAYSLIIKMPWNGDGKGIDRFSIPILSIHSLWAGMRMEEKRRMDFIIVQKTAQDSGRY